MGKKAFIFSVFLTSASLFLGRACYAQVNPPIISYVTPQVYDVGSTISPLSPTNTGGPATVDGQTSTFAGNGTAASLDGTGTGAGFNQPLGAAIDAQGNIYIADAGSHTIRKITTAGVVTTIAGKLNTPGFVDGQGANAQFYHPVGVAVDAAGYIYVADEDNNAIRKISPTGSVITLAGGTQGPNDGTGSGAQFYYPCGVVVDGSGNVYVADNNNNKIRKITSGGIVTTLAGGTQGSNDGTGSGAQFYNPFAITIDASGNLYVVDRFNQKIRKVTQTGTVTTIAGTGTAGYADGAATTTAKFQYPTAISIDATGIIYVADEQNNRIRKISSGTVSTLAGTGVSGSNNGIGNSATFNYPFGMAIDASGNLFVGEYGNNLVRKVLSTPFTITPALPSGLSFNTATGVISGTPLATSPATTYTITAHSAYGTYSTSLVITVNPAGSINISVDQNFVATFTPRISGITTNAQLLASVNDKTQVQVDIDYIDGLGRPLQNVQAKASPLGADVVQPLAYDVFSREAVKFTPYAETTTDGTYKSNALIPNAGVAAFYNPTGSSGTQLPNGIARITFPYSETAFESSPLERAVEQGSVGENWQLANKIGATNPGHSTKTVYTSNNNILWSSDSTRSMQVALYKVTINSNQSRTLSRANNTAVYDTAQLFVTITKDENWISGRAGTTEEYKDKQGHVILKRAYNYTKSLQALSTYYLYDDLGNLCFVLPPTANGDTTAAISQTTLDNLCYQYRYDERNRMSQKKVPGKGWEYTIYNVLDQTVATQDSLERVQNNWTFTKYDVFGRVALSGIWNNNNSPITRSALQLSLNGISSNLWETPISTGNGYNGLAWPTLYITTTLNLNYYDTYASIPGFPSTYNVTNGISQMTRGLLTAKRIAVLNAPSNQLWDVTYYDDLGRTIQSFAQHYFGGIANTGNYDYLVTTYNFTNQPTSVTRKHWNYTNTSYPIVTIVNTHIYDHRGRKRKTWEQITNGNLAPDTRTLISQSDYNEIGEMQTKHLHSLDSINFYQNVSYTYNERGWMLTSNAPLFSLQLQYNTGTAKAYNGNIMYQSWTSTASTNSFAYTYDKLDRVTSGKSGDGKYIERGVTYDKSGNISSLSRVYNGTLIDSLLYNYLVNTNPTNQLQSVNDRSLDAGTLGFKTGNWTYAYDGNGNMVTDNSKGLTGASGITYNMLDQPQAIAAKSTTYTYDAAGLKLRRVIGTSSTDYINGIQYDNGVITQIQTEEGRALPNGSTAYNYEYNLSDHLNDSRLTFDSATGIARIEQQDNYLPFGMDISVGTIGNPQNNYLYNKKELQQSNLQLYDYGARFYDPVIGRWSVIDKMASTYYDNSPYNYVRNNPIVRVDQAGLWDITVHAYKDRAKYGYGIAVVTDRHGKEVFRFNVKLIGVGGHNRYDENADTPTGIYKIATGKDTWISTGDRAAYGPNPRLNLIEKSGEIISTGRSLIRFHGGRQEKLNEKTGVWEKVKKPELKNTKGCMRCFDADVKSLKDVTDDLVKKDKDEKPGTVTVVDDLVEVDKSPLPYKDMDLQYYDPKDLTEEEQKKLHGTLNPFVNPW